MSFFDDGEDTEPRPSARAPRQPGDPPTVVTGGQRPHPRRPQVPGGALPVDQHTVVVRRRYAFGAGVLVLIVIILIINGCLKSEEQQALRSYNSSVSQIAHEFDEHVSAPLFSTLAGAGSKSALNVEVQIDQLRILAQNLDGRAKSLSVPGAMAAAQRNLLLALDLRVEGITKIAALAPTALGGQGQQALTQIAGDMEIFLASDVVHSQRVVPLIQQALASGGVHGAATASSRSLPNLGWLDPTTVQERITGHSASSPSTPVTGHHGSALKGVSVGATKLEPEPTLNHISGGANPTFTVQVEDAGEFTETNVKANVIVTAGGRQFKASHVVEKTEPAKSVNVDIPVSGVPLGVASKIEVNVEPVPGETNHEGTKDVFLAIFEK